MHDTAAWVTVYVCPAMVRTALRADPVLAEAVTVTDPEPVPLAGLADAQLDVPIAVQPQVELLAVTVTMAVPPAGVAAHDVAESEYVHVGVGTGVPDWNVNTFDTSLCPTPDWPMATTRASYVPSGSGQLDISAEKFTEIVPSEPTAGFPRLTVV